MPLFALLPETKDAFLKTHVRNHNQGALSMKTYEIACPLFTSYKDAADYQVNFLKSSEFEHYRVYEVTVQIDTV